MKVSFGPESADWLSPITNLAAVLLGALLAGGTAYYFEKKKEKSANLAVAYSLMFKIQFLSDEIWKLHHQITDDIERANREGRDGPLWSNLHDIVGFHPQPERVTAEELALVARTRDTSLVSDIRELDSGHQVIMQAFNKIHQLKISLTDLKLGKKVDGRIVSYGGSEQDYANYAHIFINLDDLSNGLEQQVGRIAKKARVVATKIGEKLKSHYKFKHFVSLAVAPEFADREPLANGE